MNVFDLCRLYLSKAYTKPLVNETTFDIMVTYQCNMRCKMCNIWKTYQENPALIEKELSLVDFEKLASELKELNCKTVELQGGEPFLRKDIFEIAEIMNNHDLKVRAVSNGTLITENIAKPIVNSCINITISLDGYNALNHDSNRGVKGSFEKAVKAIKNLDHARKKYNKEFRIFTHTTFTDFNLSSPRKIIELGKKLNIDGMRFTPASMGSEANFKAQLGDRQGIMDLKRYEDIVQELLELKEEYGSFIRTPYIYLKFSIDYVRSNTFARSFPCFGGYYYGLIGAWGEVYLCAGWSDSNVGNIKDSLIDAYYSRKAKEIRKKMKNLECSGCYLGCQRIYDLALCLTPKILRYKIFDLNTLRSTINDIKVIV